MENIKAAEMIDRLKELGYRSIPQSDLETMLEAVKFCVINCNKTANAAVEAANRLSEIYKTYSNKENDNESPNV